MNKNRNETLGYIVIVLLIIASALLFLPIVDLGLGFKTNYVYYNGDVCDGVFVIACAFMALLVVLAKKEGFAIIPLSISLLIMGHLYYKMNEIGVADTFTIWYYLSFGGYIASAILLVISAITNKDAGKQKTTVMNNPYQTNMYGQPLNNGYQPQAPFMQQPPVRFCTKCGFERINNSSFCPRCGQKY